MGIPYWVKKTVKGSFECLICAGIVLQVGNVWTCQLSHCEKHADHPIEKQASALWVTPEVIVGTASLPSLSPSPSPSPENEEDY